MSNVLADIRARAAAQAAVSDDMNEATSSGGRLLPARAYLGRLCEYIDLGLQPEEYKGQPKDPAPNIRLGVALFGPDASDPTTGAPYILRSSNISVKRNEKANAFKGFKAMNYKNDPNIKHFAQFIGEAFVFHVGVKTSEQSKRQYNTIEWDKTGAPINPMDGTLYAVPELADDLYRVFLWDYPTKADWDALHIEGQRDDGKSKNFIQELILGAKNFQGSPLQILLAGAGINTLPETTDAPVVAAPVQAPTTAAVPQTVAAVAPVVAPQVQQVAVPLVQSGAAPSVAVPSVQTIPPGSNSVTTATTSPTEAQAPVVAPVIAPAIALPVIPGQA